MATPNKTLGKSVAVSAGALAILCSVVSLHEGEVNKTYVDKLGRGQPLTACYGETAGVVLNKTYSHAECLGMLKASALAHATQLQGCLPAGLPDATAAGFYDLGYNVGTMTFCRSSVARKANAGDLVGACKSIGFYVYTNGKDCRVRSNKCFGIAKRRQDDVKLCLSGIK